MQIADQNVLYEALFAGENNIEVVGDAYEICNSVLQSQISATGNDWSITGSGGWLAIFSGFNQSIKRLFMSSSSKQLENLKRIIINKYVIRRTKKENTYLLELKHKKNVRK
ncbi:hypothetical protein M5C72_10195 [Companilactobacillus allii]|uniref:Uncharacterized protein n=1 Tax=Companilactobacillus allii TaxID=1847728 RepID=A0A1P8PZZ8_9LACO|nr:hypothetical protein [Companilactobacillus allii]APX71131.1 hypothetical protein BTM29_00565 [Companilactobacillus allii]USQ68212.1 hypothetical protein M5C72_10195 [Companilactobacillus allii]